LGNLDSVGSLKVARLYIKHETDLSRKGHRAHEACKVVVTWGSADAPRLLLELEVDWKEGERKPKARLRLGNIHFTLDLRKPAL